MRFKFSFFSNKVIRFLLEMKVKKALKIFLAIVPLALFLYIMGTIILKPGYIIYTDVTEGLHLDNLHERYIYTYSDDWGDSFAEAARIPLFYLTKGVHDLTGLPDPDFVKVKFILLMTISYAVFTFYTYKWLKFVTKKDDQDFFIPAVAATLFYLSNYWFTNRLMHFYLFYASCSIPITFYYLYTYLFSKKIKPEKLIVLVLLLSVFTATPHIILYQGLIGFLLVGIFLVTQKEKRVKKLLGILLFTFLYLLINSYWLLPTLSARAAPNKVLSMTVLDFLAQRATLPNVIRLMGYWMTPVQEYFVKDPYIQTVQNVLNFIPIITALAVSVFLIIKKKLVLALVLISFLVVSLFLSSQTFLSNIFYEYLMFRSPIRNFGWIFREIEKFGIIVAFIYSLSFGLLLTLLSNKLKVLFLLVFSLLIASNLYFYQVTIKNNFSPQRVPGDFFEIIDMLREDPELANAIWYPGNPMPGWADTQSESYFLTNFSSPKPTITTSPKIINYLNYIGNFENAYQIDFAKALDLIGAKYFVLRKDHGIFDRRLKLEGALNIQPNLEIVWEGDYMTLYENKIFSGIVKDYSSKILTNQGYDILKELEDLEIESKRSYLEFTDKQGFEIEENIQTYYFFPDEKYIDQAINIFSDKFIFPAQFSSHVYTGKTDRWRRSSLENETHAESEYFFSFYGIDLAQFDYGKGILSTDEGVLVEDRRVPPLEIFKPTFQQTLQGHLSNNNLLFVGDMELFTYPWTSIISDMIKLNDVEALQIKAKNPINRDQEPHLKLFLYDQDKRHRRTKYIFPDYRGNIEDTIKIGGEISYATIGLWFKPFFLEKGDILVENLYLADMSNNYKDIDFEFSVKTGCEGDCVLYARILESTVGGTMQIFVNNYGFEIETQIDRRESPQRFQWVEIGQLPLNQKDRNVNIKMINQSGFNSINSLVFLNQDERQVLDELISFYQDSPYNLITENSEDGEALDPEPEDVLSANTVDMEVKKINPTRYEVFTDSKLSILSLAIPFNKNWKVLEIPDRETITINGLISGWEVDLERDSYTIAFAPQKVFYKGVIISSATALGCIGFGIYLLISKRRKTSERTSTSQG